MADAGSEPGVLPLLSTALLELWQARDARPPDAGRVPGERRPPRRHRPARGEPTYAGLDPHRQAIARAILLRLAGPGEGAELVRRRVPLAELDADRDPAVAEVLGTLTAARLLTSGDGHVEVAHEALLREWPRLQGWLEEDAAGREVRLHLIGAVRDWEQRGREPGDLYRGARLAAGARLGQPSTQWSSTPPSGRSSTRAARPRSRRSSASGGTNRRLRGLLAGAAVLLVVALGAGGLAFLQGQRAADEAAPTQRAEADAQSAQPTAARAADSSAPRPSSPSGARAPAS